MGVSKTPHELAGKLFKAAGSLSAPKLPLIAAAETTKAIFRVNAGSLIGDKPTGHRKKIGVRDDFVGPTKVIVRYTGPAHLMNNPTKPHEIRPKGRRGKKALSFGGHAYGSVRHPGTKGKHFFEKAEAEAIKVVPGVMARKEVDVLKDIFR